MSAEQLRAVLDAFRPASASESGDRDRLLAAMASDDVWSRSSLMHVTASALVLHPPSRRVLLRWHPHMQWWMQVGGHFDPGESDPWLVARREAAEETGLTDLSPVPALGPAPVQIVIVPVPARAGEPAHEHADVRYLLVTDRPDDARAESADAALRWLPVSDAIAEAAEANLVEYLRRAACQM